MTVLIDYSLNLHGTKPNHYNFVIMLHQKKLIGFKDYYERKI